MLCHLLKIGTTMYLVTKYYTKINDYVFNDNY